MGVDWCQPTICQEMKIVNFTPESGKNGMLAKKAKAKAKTAQKEASISQHIWPEGRHVVYSCSTPQDMFQWNQGPTSPGGVRVNTKDVVLSSMDGSQEVNMDDTDDVLCIKLHQRTFLAPQVHLILLLLICRLMMRSMQLRICWGLNTHQC